MELYWNRETSLHERANMINRGMDKGREEGINITGNNTAMVGGVSNYVNLYFGIFINCCQKL